MPMFVIYSCIYIGTYVLSLFISSVHTYVCIATYIYANRKGLAFSGVSVSTTGGDTFLRFDMNAKFASKFIGIEGAGVEFQVPSEICDNTF